MGGAVWAPTEDGAGPGGGQGAVTGLLPGCGAHGPRQGVLGPGEDAQGLTGLDDAPVVHDNDVLAQGGGGQVVDDEQQGRGPGPRDGPGRR